MGALYLGLLSFIQSPICINMNLSFIKFQDFKIFLYKTNIYIYVHNVLYGSTFEICRKRKFDSLKRFYCVIVFFFS